MGITVCDELLTEFQEESATTRKLLVRVPDGKFDYKPHEKSMSMGHLASHLANMPDWATVTIKTENFEITPDQKPFLADSQKDILERFDRTLKEAVDAFAGTSDAELAKTWTMVYAGQTVVSMPRSAVLRKWVLNHMVHHRGQLSVFLRMNEIPVPAIYGPSADERQ